MRIFLAKKAYIFLNEYCIGAFIITRFYLKYQWLIFLGMGIILAITMSLFQTDILNKLGMEQFDTNLISAKTTINIQFLLYLFLYRGIPFFLLIFLSSKTKRAAFFDIYFVYLGFSCGLWERLLFVRYQWRGIPIYLAQIFPQIFCYISAFYLGYQLINHEIHRSERGIKRVVAASLLLWILGILLEWLMNPHVVCLIMQIFA